jgi:hypothetical protein
MDYVILHYMYVESSHELCVWKYTYVENPDKFCDFILYMYVENPHELYVFILHLK